MARATIAPAAMAPQLTRLRTASRSTALGPLVPAIGLAPPVSNPAGADGDPRYPPAEVQERDDSILARLAHRGRHGAGVGRGLLGSFFDFLTALFHGLPGLGGSLAGAVRDGLRRRFDRGARALHHRFRGVAGRLGRRLDRVAGSGSRVADSPGRPASPGGPPPGRP